MTIQKKNLTLVKIREVQKDTLSQIIKSKTNLSAIHQKLKNLLKTVLIVGQIQFLEAGKILEYIKRKKTFKSEDRSRKISWGEFCSQPDFPLPGPTAEARRRKADMLIRVYSVFQKKYKIDPFLLAEIGYTKLHMITSSVEAEPKKINEWLDKSLNLTESDLMKEISEGGKSLKEISDCKHLNTKKIIIWKCLDCGTILTSKP